MIVLGGNIMKKVFLVLKDRLVPFNDDYIVNGVDVLGVFETEKEAKAHALAVRSHLLKEGNREWNYVTVMVQQLHQKAYRQPAKPFECKLVIQIEFSKTFKNSHVWWRTEPLDEFYEEGYRWIRDHRVLIIETKGVFDGTWEEGKVEYKKLMDFINGEEVKMSDHEFLEKAKDAIGAHKESHPEQFI